MPGEHEEQNENKKTSADEGLDEEKNRDQAIEDRLSPNPERDHASDGDRLEDRQEKIDDVRIVELVMVRQPPARDEMPVNRDSGSEICDRPQNNGHEARCFQRGPRMGYGVH
jgi:hypothetical protein